MQDKTFEMERKRNRPEKYNRELLHKTVTAVEKVTAVSTQSAPALEQTGMIHKLISQVESYSHKVMQQK